MLSGESGGGVCIEEAACTICRALEMEAPVPPLAFPLGSAKDTINTKVYLTDIPWYQVPGMYSHCLRHSLGEFLRAPDIICTIHAVYIYYSGMLEPSRRPTTAVPQGNISTIATVVLETVVFSSLISYLRARSARRLELLPRLQL